MAPSAHDHACRNDGGSLRCQAGTGDRSAGDGAGAAEEAGKRRRELNGAEPLDRRAPRALSALDERAFRTFTEVRPQRALFVRREAPVHPPREGRFGLAAGQRALELLAERAPGAEEDGLDGGDGELQDLGDLGVRPSLEFAHDKRRALVEAQVGERVSDLIGRGDGLVGRGGRRPVVPLDLTRPPSGGAEALPALVVGNLEQPVAGLLRLLAAREGPEGAEERRLRRILGVRGIAQDCQHVPIDLVHVGSVEALEGALLGCCSAEQCGAHPLTLIDARALVTLRCLRRMSLRKRLQRIGGYGALQERNFRLLWLGRTASAIGDALIPVALAFAVIDETGSATDLGLVLAAYTVARVVLILAGGVWADRLSRRLVMLSADAVRAITQGIVAFLLITDTAEIWHLAVAGAVGGGAHAFFGPASTALVPDTVSPARLQQANALVGMTGNGAEVFGPALSGALVAAVGPGWVFAVDAVSFGVSAAFLLAMSVDESPPEETQPFLRELAGGLREIAARRWLIVSLATFAIGNLTIASFFVLGPLVIERELGGAQDWGLVVTGGAAGSLLAGLIGLRYKPQRPLLVAFLIILFEPVVLLSLIPPLPVAGVAVAAAIGFGTVAIFNVLWETVLQQQIPRHALSRVSSIDWMVSLVFMPLGFTAAGPLSDAIGVDETLWLAAALSVGATLVALLEPGLRRLQSATGPDGEASAPSVGARYAVEGTPDAPAEPPRP
jgi:predicted MFS family arabinose efflux permease